jgi:XTP/dITP diphosphohydrolase
MHRRITGRLVIATHNPGKLREMRELLLPYGIEAVSAGELGLPEPEETGSSFAENAHLKAHAAAIATGLPAFADDSGLAVDALDGHPGIFSARWAGPEKDFQRAMQRVEDELRARGAQAPSQRKGHFVSALCVAWPDGHVETFEAKVDGTLVWPPRGDQGFGYDPIFLPDGHSRTFGEMPSEEKHGLPPQGRGLSHRARAFLKLAEACLGAR